MWSIPARIIALCKCNTNIAAQSMHTHTYLTYYWWRSTVVRTSVYDRRTFPGLRHDVQLTTSDLFGVNRPLYVSQHLDKWVVSKTQAFAAMRDGAA